MECAHLSPPAQPHLPYWEAPGLLLPIPKISLLSSSSPLCADTSTLGAVEKNHFAPVCLGPQSGTYVIFAFLIFLTMMCRLANGYKTAAPPRVTLIPEGPTRPVATEPSLPTAKPTMLARHSLPLSVTLCLSSLNNVTEFGPILNHV